MKAWGRVEQKSGINNTRKKPSSALARLFGDSAMLCSLFFLLLALITLIADLRPYLPFTFVNSPSTTPVDSSHLVSVISIHQPTLQAATELVSCHCTLPSYHTPKSCFYFSPHCDSVVFHDCCGKKQAVSKPVLGRAQRVLRPLFTSPSLFA